MKKFLFSLLLLSVAIAVSAQRKKFQFEMGLNYPLSFQKDGYKESRVGLFLGGTYNFADSPLSLGLKLSFENYSIVKKQYPYSPFNGRSLSVVPSLKYNFFLSSKAIAYAGGGAGLSMDNINTGVFNEGRRLHFLVSPLVGIELWRHVNLSAQYHLTAKDFSRLMIGASYVF